MEKNTITVKELKDLLEKYNDTDEVFLYLSACGMWSTAELLINDDVAMKTNYTDD